MAERFDPWYQQQLEQRGLEDNRENRRILGEEWKKIRANKAKTPESTGGTTPVEPVLGGGMISGTTMDSSPFFGTSYAYPSRKANLTQQNIDVAETTGGFKVIETPSGRSMVYSGEYLVNENGDLARPAYDRSGGDLLSEYASITDPTELKGLLTTLKEYGFYGESGTPSALALSGIGMEDKDERALQGFLNYSSGKGRVWRAALPILQGQAKLYTSGTGRAVSVVSTEDATRSFKEESLRILGRMPTQQEIRAAVSNIQATERSRGAGGTMDAPSLTTATQEQARKAAPVEAAAQAAGTAVNQIFALLGGR